MADSVSRRRFRSFAAVLAPVPASVRPASVLPASVLPASVLPAAVLLGSVLLGSSPTPGNTGPLVATSSIAAVAVTAAAEGAVDDADGAPADPAADAAPDAARLGISPESAEHQAELVRGEDARLVDIRVAEANRPGQRGTQPFRVRSAGLYTLVLTPRRDAYTLDDLRVLAPQTFLLQPDGSYLLREHILVEAGATLAVTPQKPTTIKLASGVDGFVSIVAHGGRLRLLGTAAAPLTIQSWDTTAGRPDDKLDDGRAYVRAMGQLIARHTSFAQLGFWSGRTGGVAMIGSQLQVAQVDPVVAKARAAGASSSRRQTSVLPAGALPSVDGTADVSPGEVSDCRMDRNAFGLFVSGTAGAKVSHVTMTGSLVSGLVLHRGVTSTQVEAVNVSGSGLDGIVVARGVEGTVVTQSVSRGNGRDGMVIAGSPLAAGPSAGGESTRPFGNNVLSTNQVEANRRSGVRVVGGTNLRLMGNAVSGGNQGILVTHGATGVVVDGNRVTDVAANGIQVREATGIEITGNTVRRAATGVHVSAARVTVRDNTVAGATLHALTFVGDVQGSIASENTLGGSGSSAVDVARSAADRGPTLGDNDAARWQRTVTKDTLLSTLGHPMTMVWLLIGLALAITWRPPRRGPGTTRPYLDSPPLPVTALAIGADQDVALAAVGAAPVAPAASAGTGPGLPQEPSAASPGPSWPPPPYHPAAAVPMPAASPYALQGIAAGQPHDARYGPRLPEPHHPHGPQLHEPHHQHHPNQQHYQHHPNHPNHPHDLHQSHHPHGAAGHGLVEDGDRPGKQRAAHRHGRGDGGPEPVHEQVAEVGPGLLGADVAPGPGEDTATWLRRVGAV